MIAYDLICSNGHVFECWFRDSVSFEKQKEAGVINCPLCNDNRVERVLSTFSIKRNNENKKKEMARQIDTRQILEMLQTYVEKNFEDVGLDFAKEALKIHYGDSRKRNIRGTASEEEEAMLRREGVPFLKIPIVKRLDN